MKTLYNHILVALFCALSFICAAPAVHAGSATWEPNPINSDWNNNGNWTPAVAPNGSGDTATFDVSTVTSLFLSANTEVNGIVFDSAASAYSITASPTFTLTMSGTGITNNSAVTQNFATTVDNSGNAGRISFTNSATAGNHTTFTNNGRTLADPFAFGGVTEFHNTSTGGGGVFNNLGGGVSGANGGFMQFFDSSSAGTTSTFTANGGAVAGAFGAQIEFQNTSTASSGSFTTNGGAVTDAGGGATSFNQTASAGSATFITNGSQVANGGSMHNNGQTNFFNNATGFNGRFTNNGGAASGADGGATQFFDTSNAGANSHFTNNAGAADGANGGSTNFFNGSSAGAGAFTNNSGPANAPGGSTNFNDSSNAGLDAMNHATFTNNGATSAGPGAGFTEFNNTSTAGTGIFINNGSAVSNGAGGFTFFFQTADAGHGSFTNNGGAGVGFTQFNNNSNAANGTFTNNGGASGLFGGFTQLTSNSSAGSGLFTNNGGSAVGGFGGSTQFLDSSTAASATLIANAGMGGAGGGDGGSVRFVANSTGGTARVEVFGDGNLDISSHNAAGVAVGSIEGTGNVFLGANNLAVGSNNMSTIFSGVIQDGGIAGGTGGSLTKTGTGTLSLTNSNTFSGGTLINLGTFVAAHDGALGNGSVSLTASSVTLTLQNGATNNYIANTASLTIVSGSHVNLSFTGTPDTIGSLLVDGVPQAPGLYGSSASGAPNQLPEFSGMGTVLVAAVPEPSVWAMMSFGLGMLLCAQQIRGRTPITRSKTIGPPRI